jgi:hypothetical protein
VSSLGDSSMITDLQSSVTPPSLKIEKSNTCNSEFPLYDLIIYCC